MPRRDFSDARSFLKTVYPGILITESIIVGFSQVSVINAIVISFRFKNSCTSSILGVSGLTLVIIILGTKERGGGGANSADSGLANSGLVFELTGQVSCSSNSLTMGSQDQVHPLLRTRLFS